VNKDAKEGYGRDGCEGDGKGRGVGSGREREDRGLDLDICPVTPEFLVTPLNMVTNRQS